tara:strand:+ start:1029 stop:1220 length:192 start_codon:yes stop_codon:yes gene_type:complete
MFGYGKRIKKLESVVERLLQLEQCHKGRHDWEFTNSELASWPSYKGCRCCRKTVALVAKKEAE